MKANSGSEKLTGRHALIGFCTFFAVVFLANGVFLYWALATHTGIETPDAYRRGLTYNSRIADAELQKARGWTDRVALDRKTRRLQVQIATAGATPVTGLLILANVGRPSTRNFDSTVTLRETSPGRYSASIAHVDAGSWLVTFEARQGPPENERVVYRAKRRLWLKP